MAYFVVKILVQLLGIIHSIFCGEFFCVAVRKDRWHILCCRVLCGCKEE